MYEAVLANLDENDVVIKSAAVADYKPKNYSNKKIKKSDDDLDNVMKLLLSTSTLAEQCPGVDGLMVCIRRLKLKKK